MNGRLPPVAGFNPIVIDDVIYVEANVASGADPHEAVQRIDDVLRANI